MTTEINKERCRYYAELLAKLADGTHTVEENENTTTKWAAPSCGSVLIRLNGDENFTYRAVEIKQPPKTVTVYVYEDEDEGEIVVSTDAEKPFSKLLKTVEIDLTTADSPPSATSATASNVVDGIDWDALPDEAQWVAMDVGGEWYWFEKEPKLRSAGSRVWSSLGGGDCGQFDSPRCFDYKTSLQRRPRPK